MEMIAWIIAHRDSLKKAVLGLCIAFLIGCSTLLYNKNKKLSESLEMAQNNIEAYQGLFDNSQQANNVLQLSYEEMRNSRDSLLQKLDSVREELEIKPKHLQLAATQTQTIDVNAQKEIPEGIVIKDTIFSDSILYNALTKVNYTIGKDTISIGLQISNTQYLFLYTKKEYKNKKNFFKRLFTWDWKKTTKYRYEQVNTNDLFDIQDVRIVDINDK